MTSLDKCSETISIKVTPSLKALYDDLSQEQKKHTKMQLIEVIERNIHESRFRKGMYLGED